MQNTKLKILWFFNAARQCYFEMKTNKERCLSILSSLILWVIASALRIQQYPGCCTRGASVSLKVKYACGTIWVQIGSNLDIFAYFLDILQLYSFAFRILRLKLERILLYPGRSRSKLKLCLCLIIRITGTFLHRWI